jgi:hypothetical protein
MGKLQGRGAMVDGHLHLKEREGLTFSEELRQAWIELDEEKQ